MTKTKPQRVLSLISACYGDFDLVFSQIATDDAVLYIADSGCWDGETKTKPGKAIEVKSIKVSKID